MRFPPRTPSTYRSNGSLCLGLLTSFLKLQKQPWISLISQKQQKHICEISEIRDKAF